MHELRPRLGLPAEASAQGGSADADRAHTARRSHLERSFDGAGWQRLLFVADVVALVAAIACARLAAPDAVVAAEGQTLLWLYPPVALGVLAMRGTYRENLKLRTLDEVMRIVAATSLAAMLVIAGGAIVGTNDSPRAPRARHGSSAASS